MIILNSSEDLKEIISRNKNKNIGKLDINYNKIIENEKYLHDGHLYCIKYLRKICDILILECINPKKCFESIKIDKPKNLYFDDANISIDIKTVINNYSKLDIDYFLYNSKDYHITIPKQLIKCVNDVIKFEDYVNRFKISNDGLILLKTNLIVRTFRNLNDLTYIKSYKDGNWVFALKHYMYKYLNNKLIIIPPILDKFNFPLFSSIQDPELDVKMFSYYFYTIPNHVFLNKELLKKCLILFCFNIGGELLNFKYLKIENQYLINVKYRSITKYTHKFVKLIYGG